MFPVSRRSRAPFVSIYKSQSSSKIAKEWMSEYYATRMQDYLIANGTNIPEFFETTGDTTNIFPDQSNQYFGGLNL